jgi:hypothetical protein
MRTLLTKNTQAKLFGMQRWLVPAIFVATIVFALPQGLLAQAPSGPVYRQTAFTDYTNQTSGALTFNAQLTMPGDVIVVSCIYKPQYGHCTTPPTDTEGNTYALVSTKETSDGNAGQRIYQAFNIAGGTNDIITCYSETITAIGCLAVELTGVNALDVGSDSTQAAGNGTSPVSPAINTTQATEILLGFAGMNPGSGSTFTSYGAGWTGIVQGSQSAEYKIVTSVGSYTATAGVATADDWVIGAFAYYQAPPITLQLNPQTVAASYPSVGKVILAPPAPPGGATVLLSSNNTNLATPSVSVVVPAGLTSATFAIATGSPSLSTTVQVSAKYNNATTAASLVVVPVNASPQYSIWSSSATPSVLDDGGTSPIEVGVKFTTDTSGFVSGLRFYKSVANTGTHVGNLWNAAGQLLATATFTGETASGWQYVYFASPILLAANTTYVASYHTDIGHTSNDQSYFANTGVDNAPLHALSSTAGGGNGVSVLSATSAFPTDNGTNSNYWVDVVFMTVFTPPQIQSLTLNPSVVTGGMANSNGTVTLSAPAPPDGLTVNLSSNLPAAATVPATVVVASGQTVSPIFTVTSTAVNVTALPSITATFNGGSQSATLTVNPVEAAGVPQVGDRIRLNATANVRATAVNNGYGTLLGTEPSGALGTVIALSNAITPSKGGVWIQVKFDTCSGSIPNCTGWIGSDNPMTDLSSPPPTLTINCTTAKQAFTAANMPTGTILTVTGTAGGKTATCNISLP